MKRLRHRVPAWKMSRDGLAFRAAFLQCLLGTPGRLATADEAVSGAERGGRRLGMGTHIGPVIADLRRRGVIEPHMAPDGFRASIQSSRKARHRGLSGVWLLSDARIATALLDRTRELLAAFPQDPREPPTLFDRD